MAHRVRIAPASMKINTRINAARRAKVVDSIECLHDAVRTLIYTHTICRIYWFPIEGLHDYVRKAIAVWIPYRFPYQSLSVALSVPMTLPRYLVPFFTARYGGKKRRKKTRYYFRFISLCFPYKIMGSGNQHGSRECNDLHSLMIIEQTDR